MIAQTEVARRISTLFVATGVAFLFSQAVVRAQEPLKSRVSPLEVVSNLYGDTYLKIIYSRPSMNDREIFGSLVPYGEVWRTGANEATEITLTRDILCGGDSLRAGTYSLFTIPDSTTWTIIINKDLGMWGSYRYNPDHDIMRFIVQSERTEETYEPFTIDFQEKGIQRTNILLMWEDTKAAIPIQFQEPEQNN